MNSIMGIKVDLLGNGILSWNFCVVGVVLVWNFVFLFEVRVGYWDVGNGGLQVEGGLRVNYFFGMLLYEQFDYCNVGVLLNMINWCVFVDCNYDIVMVYWEQVSKICIMVMLVLGLFGMLVILMVMVDSCYLIEKVEWLGDVEFFVGFQFQGSLGSGFIFL